MPSRTNILIFTFSCILVFLSLEVLLRGYYMFFRQQNFFSTPENKLKNFSTPTATLRIFGRDYYDRSSPPRFIIDRYGKSYPYHKEANTFRIVCLGGSTTENKNNFEQNSIHYPLILEKLLKEHYPNKTIEVINAGYAAYSTVQIIALLAFDISYWQPDLIIFSENINDLTAAYWPNFRTDYANKYNTSFYSAPDYRELYSLPNIIFQYSRLYWFVKKRWTLLNAKTKPTPNKVWGDYQDAPPTLAAQVFANNLQTIATLAKKAAANVLFASQPHSLDQAKFYVPQSAKPYHDTTILPRHSIFLKHHDYFNGLLADSAKTANVFYLDQASLLNGKEENFADIVHYSDHGVHVLAKNYATFIIQQRFIE